MAWDTACNFNVVILNQTIFNCLITSVSQRRYDTVDLCAIIAKFNCIPMLKWQCSGDCAATIASNADTE